MTNDNSSRAVVSLAKCSSYSTGVHAAVLKVMAELGGMSAYVKQGQTVLIKPNLLSDHTPTDAVTTHPEIVRAIIKIVRAAGGEPVVGDSPASVVKLERIWEVTGFKAMCAQENVPLVSFEQSKSVLIESSEGFTFNVAKQVIDADVIINVPKLKTHVLTTLTAAMKNMFGIIPGYQKAMLHKAHPKQNAFGRLIVEIYKQVPPTLNIVDAITGMEGNGPSGGRPIDFGFIAASASALALDMTLCCMLNISTEAVPYLRNNIIKDISSIKTAEIEIVGTDHTDLIRSSIHLPSTIGAKLIPEWLVKLLSPFFWIRPFITDVCVSCGKCTDICPANALEIKEKSKKPVFNAKKCIGCCCCHEICPKQAIEMNQSPLINFIRLGKSL